VHCKGFIFSTQNNPYNESKDVEDVEAGTTSDSEFLAEFRKKAQEIELLIKSLGNLVEELETKYNEHLNKIDDKTRKGRSKTFQI
jgi:molybdopterin converting factor small subunit